MAIYLGDTKLTGTGIQVDDALSSTSTNPAQNKAITEALTEVGYSEWQKPSDWVDIRSGALDNSVYLLVAHSTPTESEGVYAVETYPQFHILAQVSTSGNTYDVFVDGLKVATTATNTKTVLDWATLYGNGTVSTIYTTTHPSALVYHIVRITPTVSTDTLTRFKNNTDANNVQQGIMWAHYELSNAIGINNAFSGESRPRNLLLEAVTAKNNKITYAVLSHSGDSGFYCTFTGCSSLVQIPILEAENQTYASGTYLSFSGVPARKVIIRNNKGTEQISLIANSMVKEFDVENGVSPVSGTTAWQLQANSTTLIKLPSFSKYITSNSGLHMQNLLGLQPTVFDDSNFHGRTKLTIQGTSASNFVSGLKGLVVSNQAPFDGTSPQINVKNTGLSRSALVNLFKSMPYNVGYETVGSPTITDGVASGFSSTSYFSFQTIPFGTANTWEFQVAFGIPDTVTGTQYVVGNYSSGGGIRVYVSENGYVYVLPTVPGQKRFTYNAGSYYIVKVTFDGSTYSYDYCENNGSWVNLDTVSSTEKNGTANSDTIIGNTQAASKSYPFLGTIDLNNTYIKVNGIPWFTGKAAMTKTCNVVGCTGTADLTQADKDIALDKGWSLTVA